MEKTESNMPLIGDKAPEFHAVTTRGNINFPQDYHGKWVVLFSYQEDFSPVCSTEIMMFGIMTNEFKEINTEIIGLSADSIHCHIAWLRRIKELAWKDIKHVDIIFPIISDSTLEISKKYGMIQTSCLGTLMVSAVFIIDPEGKVRAILVYPAAVGRNIQEIKRILMALQRSDHDSAATPVNWVQNDDIILLPPDTYEKAAERLETVTDNSYCLDWYLCFRQLNCTSDQPEINPYPSAYPLRNRQGNRR